MLYQVKGVCQNCCEEYSVIVFNNKILAGCEGCKELPVALKPYKGLVYIIKNENQRGLKIGMTEKSIESRLRSLNNTSVPGKFFLIAIFPSNRPKKDEERIHKKLEKFNMDKEHFDIEPVEAILRAFRTLKRRPIIARERDEKEFEDSLEKARVLMKSNLLGNRASQ